MTTFTDSLRGYGHGTYERDDYTCRYCGADGRKSFDVWLSLSVDHLLPVGHPDREKDEFKVTACRFCNEADNQYFKKYDLSFDGLTPDELLEQRRRIYSPIHENLLKSRDFELMKPIKNHIGLVKNAMRTDR